MGTADSPGFFGPHDNVYIYVPNLIGYGRVLCYIASLCYAFHNKERCLWLYFWGFFGDLLDGKAARALGQSSTMGAVLDMVSDRMATTSFLIILSHLYPDLWLFFVSLSILDLSSHWFQMYSALLEKRKSHKDASKSGLFLVNFYYTHYWFFGYCCVGAEVMYLALYLLHDPYYAAKPALPIDGSFLAPLAGSAFNGNLSLVSAIALFCAPGFVTKQIVNVFQLCSSADIIVQYDLAQRKSK
mmetsp:Transcript_38887/g.72992  ORF Transcript_38887/g.72992 Transcript_38887/m.72992 type:complete len:242 (-) Transcript_38887:236-961(-)